jgi:hypothetical protein
MVATDVMDSATSNRVITQQRLKYGGKALGKPN